jgi:peptide/nickel transport system permease protein
MIGVGAQGHAQGGSKRSAKRAPLYAAVAFVTLVALNIAGWIIPEERSREELRFEPPQFAALQKWLWASTIKDTVRVVDVFAASDAPTPGRTHTFESVPLLTARVGRRYEYAPKVVGQLSDFSVENAPNGITIDPSTGALTGTPTAASVGSYDIVVSGRLDAAQRVEQRFTLFVDDRFLPLGADRRGRSVSRRLLSASKYTILPGLVVVLVSVVGGAILGAVGGFYAGVGARTVTMTTTVLQAVPGLLLIFLIAVLSEFSLGWTMVAVGLVLLPETAMGLFGQVQRLRERDFIEAARELGMRNREIIWSEIVWHNGRVFLLNRATQGFIFAILVDVTLSYMKLTDPNTPRFGAMVLDGRQDLVHGALLALAPLAAILIIVGTFALAEFGVSKAWERAR